MHRKFNKKSLVQFSDEIRSTHILDLNEDCIRESFEYLSLSELSIVADVCGRFRQIARTHFSSTKYKHLKLNFVKNRFLDISRVLRNFGASIVSIYMPAASIPAFPIKFGRPNSAYWDGLLDSADLSRELMYLEALKLIWRYCNGNLEGLLLESGYDESCLSDLIGHTKWPPMLYLKSLFLDNICTSFILDSQRLSLMDFSKLEALFLQCRYVRFYVIDKFLAKCPHLKELIIQNVDGGIFQLIAEHLPKIENLIVVQLCSHDGDAKYIGSLNKLKTLEISLCFMENICGIFDAIAMGDAALEQLKLNRGYCADLSENANQFDESISKLKNLRSLILIRVRDMDARHLFKIVNNAKALIEIELAGMPIQLTEKSLIGLIRNAEKLQYFRFESHECKKIHINGDTFVELVNIVKKRHQKTHLRIDLDVHCAKMSVPVDLAQANGDLLTVNLIETDWSKLTDEMHFGHQASRFSGILDAHNSHFS